MVIHLDRQYAGSGSDTHSDGQWKAVLWVNSEKDNGQSAGWKKSQTMNNRAAAVFKII